MSEYESREPSTYNYLEVERKVAAAVNAARADERAKVLEGVSSALDEVYVTSQDGCELYNAVTKAVEALKTPKPA